MTETSRPPVPPRDAEGQAIPVAAGRGWLIADFACTAGPGDRPFEEQHEGMTVALVRRGSFSYRSDTGRALLHSGAILLGNARACYSCGHDHGVGDLCRSLKLSGELFGEIAATHARSARFCWPVPMLPALREHQPPAGMLGPPGTTGTMGLELAVLGYAATLLRHMSGTPVQTQPVSSRDERRIARVLRHMEAHATRALDLDVLAGVAAMSKFHFVRVFRRITGITPHGYLIGLRLDRATSLLRGSPAPVSAIALEAGFEDLSTFNAAFRHRYGLPPNAYRMRYGQT